RVLDAGARLGDGWVSDLRGWPVLSAHAETADATWLADRIVELQASEHTLAVPDDGRAGEGGEADAFMRAGLTVANQRGMSAPPAPAQGA
ncbi:MAG: hypothetical protein ACKOFP_05085, partial [Actinomycetota bacterium]